MVKIVDKQTAFNTGIITNKLRGRDDLKQYDKAVGDAVNFIASKYGPIIKRVGTKFEWDVGNVGKKVVLIPFVFSVKQAIILEFLDKKIRFYTFNGVEFGPIEDPETPGKQYEIATPFTEDQLEHLSYAQSLDVVYIAVPGGKTPPKELKRYANDNWVLEDYEFEDGPYLDQNYNQKQKVKVDKTEVGSVTLTVSGFKLTQNDVGRHIRINHIEPDTLEDRWGWGIITKVESATSATVDMQQKAWGTTATADFRLGAWGKGVGWPTLCTIHEQRLCWAGTTNYPWLWMSNSFNYHNFSPSDYSGVVKDTNAIYYNMSTDKVADVKWLASLGSLIIGTDMYEMRMYSAGAGLAPGDCVNKKETTYGAHDALPVITDATLVFIQRLQRTLRAIAYDYTRDAYVGPELSVLAESLTMYGMKKLVFQREPNSIVWVLNDDGSLLAVVYDKEQDVTAWTKVEIAGKNTRVIDIISIPSVGYLQDMLVLEVEREINEETKRYMEVLSRELLDNVPLTEVPYLDSSLRYQGEATTELTGLNHLEGEKVRVIEKGALHEDVEVKEGKVTLKVPVTDCWVGLPYNAYFETLERDFGDRQISVKASKLRIHRLVIYMLRTLGLTVKQIARGMETELITFTPVSTMDVPPEPVSGQREVDIMTSWTSSDLSYILRVDSEPGLPCTIAGIFTGIELNAL